MLEPLSLSLQDVSWPFTYTDHDRQIARAILLDDAGRLYFVRVKRKPGDRFGEAEEIETSGGGVEAGETPETAILRELKEEMGAEVTVLRKIGIVDDYYNLIHRHNINHYFLCRVNSFGETAMTPDEIARFQLSTLVMSWEEAEAEYIRCGNTPIGRLVMNRELPVLHHAKAMVREMGL